MEIMDYSSEYADAIKALLTDLQVYIACLDKEKYNIMTENFGEEYFEKTIEDIGAHSGKIFIAKEQDEVVGMISGIVDEEENTCGFCAPKRGHITELIVASDCRGRGIGRSLLCKMENYFSQIGCKGVLIDVFAYNESGRRFYRENGYFERTVQVMKKI